MRQSLAQPDAPCATSCGRTTQRATPKSHARARNTTTTNQRNVSGSTLHPAFERGRLNTKLPAAGDALHRPCKTPQEGQPCAQTQQVRAPAQNTMGPQRTHAKTNQIRIDTHGSEAGSTKPAALNKTHQPNRYGMRELRARRQVSMHAMHAAHVACAIEALAVCLRAAVATA